MQYFPFSSLVFSSLLFCGLLTSSAYCAILGDLNISYSSCGGSQPTMHTNHVKVCGDLLHPNKNVTNNSNGHVWHGLQGRLCTREWRLLWRNTSSTGNPKWRRSLLSKWLSRKRRGLLARLKKRSQRATKRRNEGWISVGIVARFSQCVLRGGK